MNSLALAPKNDTDADVPAPRQGSQQPAQRGGWSAQVSTRAIRVYGLDDHPLYLQGIAGAMTPERGMIAVGLASTLEQALDEARRLAPDVMLVDMVMPGRRGAETIATLRTLLPRARLLAVSCTLKVDDARRALAAGAAGYLLKTTTAAELQAAVLAVFHDQVALSPEVRTALNAAASAPSPGTHLTPRERDLLGLLARGLGNKAIADALSVSIPTVKFHVTNILWKLRADNRTAAVVKAVQQQLVHL